MCVHNGKYGGRADKYSPLSQLPTDTWQHHLCVGSTTWEGLGRPSHSGLLWVLFLLGAKALGTAGGGSWLMEPPTPQPLTTEDALSPHVLLLTQTLKTTRQDSLASPFQLA